MSKLTHYFDLNVPKVEHHMVSESDALTITAQASAGEGETFLASKNGLSNHVAGFTPGEDKILVPLELIQELVAMDPGASVPFPKGPLPAENFVNTGSEEYLDEPSAYSDNISRIHYPIDGEGRLYFVTLGDKATPTCLLALDGKPTLAAADIEII